ncbi:unnamed protein product [Blepharisma stoltei]|uniref:Uncharacterized protein n=1 Tax=Blepharisma stoltei TaxID=1481888 RepID=A0AAU9INB4_9CILI|nr:unnamed protein product [Blepharisma stoltei]
MYINEKASRLLKSSVGNIIGSSFLNFIPHPFDTCHLAAVKDFVFDSDTIELPSHSHLFFQDIHGYLIECNFLIKLTAFHNFAYFLVTFEQRKEAREIAIISDDAFIMGHSELFPFYINSESKNLKGQNLSNLLPNLDIKSMKNYELWLAPFNGGEIAFINVKKQIKSMTINGLMIIHEEEEIQKWKEGTAQDQQMDQEFTFDYEKSQLEVNRIKGTQDQFLSNSNNISLLAKPSDETGVNSHEEFHIKEKALRLSEDKKLFIEDYSKSSTTSKNSSQAKTLLLDTKRKIRVLQVALFLVVSLI